MHLTGGILRHFRALSTPEQNPALGVLSTPAHPPVTLAVRRLGRQSKKDFMKVLIEEYKPSWVHEFLVEKDIIDSTLIGFNPAIEHIGSTSVIGLSAKPTIDILVGVHKEEQLDKTVYPMTSKGYTYFRKYEASMPYRRLFSKLKALTAIAPPKLIDFHDEFVRGKEFVPVANIQIIVKDTPHWKRHLAFRDFLQVHPDLRDKYGQLKKELSRREFKDTNDYNNAKDDFIKQIQEQALIWYETQRQSTKNT